MSLDWLDGVLGLSTTRRTPKPGTLGIALMALLTVGTLGVIALVAMGRLRVLDAAVFAVAPWALLAAALRPDWLLLGLIAMPASITVSIPTKRTLLLIAVALAILAVSRQKLSLGLRTGLVALVCILAAGLLFQANVGEHAIAIHQVVMLQLVYYLLLALLAFNLALLGELDGGPLATAFVVGVVSTLVVGLAGYGGAWFESGPGIITHTYLGLMAAAALGVTLAPLLVAEEFPGKRLICFLMSGILLWLVIASLSRASWIAATITFALVAFRSRRRSYVLILTAAIVLALLSPTVRQQISRSESGDIVAQLRTGQITTGRWQLWSELWDRARPALPWGNGFGYMSSLSSEELFGAPDLFGSHESLAVPPHNDFIYLLVEFGIPGVLLLAFFWVQLFRARGLVLGSADPQFRRSGWLFLGVLVTGLIFALIDDVFAVQPIAERFFPVAGFMFGLAQLERARRQNARGSRIC